jgi:shikimate kinase
LQSNMNPSPNLFLVGPMGAGKSTVGRRIADHYRLPFVDMDEELERRTGVSVSLIFEVEGEAGFRVRETRLLAELAEMNGVIVATGGGAILAEENREIMRRNGFVLYLPVSVAQQMTRLARDNRRPLLRAPDRRERLQQMALLRTPLYESTADFTLPPEGGSVGRSAQRARQALDQNWVRHSVAA